MDRTEPAGIGAGNHGGSILVSFFVELWEFLKVRRKFWLVPVFVLMLIFGGLIVLVQGSAVAPFIYTMF